MQTTFILFFTFCIHLQYQHNKACWIEDKQFYKKRLWYIAFNIIRHASLLFYDILNEQVKKEEKIRRHKLLLKGFLKINK